MKIFVGSLTRGKSTLGMIFSLDRQMLLQSLIRVLD